MSTERGDAQPTSGTADIGGTGLAVMRSTTVRSFARNGYTVVVHNRSAGKTDAPLSDHGDDGTLARTETLEDSAAALTYVDGLGTECQPAALIQGQRDFFGAHTNQRTDRDGGFHTLWNGYRSEVQV